MDYWLNKGDYNSMPFISISGPGVSNATVTSLNFSNYLELTLSSGTVSNGASYTWTGPVVQKIGITGSLYATNNLGVAATNGNTISMTGGGFSAIASNADAASHVVI
jgi:hypothetical protein